MPRQVDARCEEQSSGGEIELPSQKAESACDTIHCKMGGVGGVAPCSSPPGAKRVQEESAEWSRVNSTSRFFGSDAKNEPGDEVLAPNVRGAAYGAARLERCDFGHTREELAACEDQVVFASRPPPTGSG